MEVFLVNNVNDILKNKKQEEIDPEKVHQKPSKSSVGLMKAISDIVWKEDGKKFTNLVSKRELSERLIHSRITDIRIER